MVSKKVAVLDRAPTAHDPRPTAHDPTLHAPATRAALVAVTLGAMLAPLNSTMIGVAGSLRGEYRADRPGPLARLAWAARGHAPARRAAVRRRGRGDAGGAALRDGRGADPLAGAAAGPGRGEPAGRRRAGRGVREL